MYKIDEVMYVWLTPEAELALEQTESSRFLYFEQEYTRGTEYCDVETTILPVREDECIQNYATHVRPPMRTAPSVVYHYPYTFSIDTRKPACQQVAITSSLLERRVCEMSVSEFLRCKMVTSNCNE